MTLWGRIEVRVWNAEDAFDAVGISDGYLDVIFSHEGRAGIKLRWLLKDAFDAVYGRLAFFVADFVQIVNDSAIERMEKLVRSIYGKGSLRHFVQSCQLIVRIPGHLYTSTCREVQAEAEVKDRAYNKGFFDPIRLAHFYLVRKFQAA